MPGPPPKRERAGQQAAQELNALHAAAHAVGETPPWRDEAMRRAFDRVQRFLTDAPPAVPGRLKATIYGPYFRWTSVDGMVDPFALEVMADPDLLPIERALRRCARVGASGRVCRRVRGELRRVADVSAGRCARKIQRLDVSLLAVER